MVDRGSGQPAQSNRGSPATSTSTAPPKATVPNTNASDASASASASNDSTSESLSSRLDHSLLRVQVIKEFRAEKSDGLHKLLLSSDEKTLAAIYILHLAVQIAPLETVKWIVNNIKVDINLTDLDGNTPLHLAAQYGRSDVAVYLLSLPQINDTILNKAGKQPVELSKYIETAEAMQVARAEFVEKAALKLRTCFANNDIPGLEKLLADPRAAALLDINGLDPDSGSTVLHDFVRKKNIPMIEFIIAHGGDPFRRDSKGALPIDLTKDERIKKILKSASKNQSIIPEQHSSEANKSGYLKKWTNTMGGYKLRWFVLSDGVLSYYKKHDDIEKACRGSINLANAEINISSTEKNKFEITTKGGAVRYHLKTNHATETGQWVWAIKMAIRKAKDDRQANRGATSGDASVPKIVTTLKRTGSLQSSQTGGAPDGTITPHSRASAIPQHLDAESSSVRSSRALEAASVVDSESVRSSRPPNSENSEDEDLEEEEEEFNDDFDHGSLISNARRTATVESDLILLDLKAIRQLVVSLADFRKDGHLLSQQDIEKTVNSLDSSLLLAEKAFQKYVSSVHDQFGVYERRIENHRVREGLWTQNIEALERDYENIRGELYKAVKDKKEIKKILKQHSELLSPSSPGEARTTTQTLDQASKQLADGDNAEKVSDNRRSSILAVIPPNLLADDSDDSDDEFFDVSEGKSDNSPPLADETKTEPNQGSVVNTGQVSKDEKTIPTGEPSAIDESTGDSTTVEKTESKSSADIFFQTEDESKLQPEQRKILDEIKEEKSWAGYENGPRKKLKLDADNRPSISLWGILKNAIGKDMTRVTLPVSFNECTNLLMRSAEDMEYTELLDKAASLGDPADRMTYVAAYCTSSYSSTVGRVAKPFNPLLGETFEYCRPDKGFRMYSEQVSHHPPVGALVAESPRWTFYGDSTFDSKFTGRSFDINPLGLWYIVIRPDDGDVEEELYSFRKVTSSAVGILLGNPSVDNYGDMTITNHTTGHICELKFKKAGWRGAGAHEVKGNVLDPNGKTQWIVKGHWNDKLYAKKADSSDDKAILLWKANPRIKAPFNLTPFAITLNNLDEKLEKWVAPTDTRFRPDQRAMEEGRYDEAEDGKMILEKKQRDVRKLREQKGINYKPLWFKKSTHPVTKQVFYEPTNEYWLKRKDHDFKVCPNIYFDDKYKPE